MRRLWPALIAMSLLAVPASGTAVTPTPTALGHACSPMSGVLFCPAANDSQRVPSFDGLPLDVDVTLPVGVPGPHPTIVMLHGFPGTKQTFEASTANTSRKYDNVYFAQQGYAVVNYSARGFGRSCGVPNSRNVSGCNRGWFHLADQRYEIRDAQFLIGKLVDEGVTDPKRIGVTGVSYGGGSTLQLAFLKNRIRKLNGGLAPWTSPAGTPLSIAAAYPLWGWSDLGYSLTPNGRFLDFRLPSRTLSANPIGVSKMSVVNILYFGGVGAGFLSPPGADPTADLATWRQLTFAGNPFGAAAEALEKQFATFKSAIGIPGKPAPLLIMDGWTDPVFNATEALRPYMRLLSADPGAPISLQLGDLGHFRAGNAAGLYRTFGNQGAAFFAHYLNGKPGGPKPGQVTVFGQGCPKGTLGPGPYTVSRFAKPARGDLSLHNGGSTKLPASGGTNATGTAFDPVANGDPCSTIAAETGPGTVVLSRTSPGVTLAGLTTVEATIKESKSFGQLDARLWDVFGGRQRLIDFGVYRVNPKQRGTIVFQLPGNTYRFSPGHTIKLELVARNEPTFLADHGFSVRVSNVTAHLPTRQKPSRHRGIRPIPARFVPLP